MIKQIKQKRVTPYITICIISAAVFAATAIMTVNGVTSEFNLKIAEYIQSFIYTEHGKQLTLFMKTISNIGEWYIYVPIVVLLLAFPKTRIKIGLPAFATLAVSALFNVILKNWFAVPRPDINRIADNLSGYGFPSGHAMNGTAFIGICAVLFVRRAHKYKTKILVATAGVILLLLIGLSRIYLGAHSPCDVIAGYSAGIFLCSLCVLISL